MIADKYLINQVTGERGVADSIHFPTNIAEVLEIVNQTRTNNQKLITIGSNTGLSGATFPDKNQVLISLEKMKQIIALNAETATLTVEPGVTLAEIADFLQDTPYFYAPDPGSKRASIGGTAATNAGGMKAVKYGVTRDNIRGMKVVLANGKLIQAGSINRKDSSGYDLKNIFIGSEGTLGIIVELDLKLTLKPTFTRDILLGFATLEELAPQVFNILQKGITPCTLEFLGRDSFEFSQKVLPYVLPEIAGQQFLLITLDGFNQEQLEQDLAYLQTLSQAFLILNEEQREQIWKLRGAIVTGMMKESIIEPLDIVVPINQVANTILHLKNMALDGGLEAVFFGHAGDGNIHAGILKRDLTEQEWQQKLDIYLDNLYAFVASIGGKPSAEHGIGLVKKKFFQKYVGGVELELMKTIKKAFDPDNILNPDKIFDL
jgi:glycolate oxidase